VTRRCGKREALLVYLSVNSSRSNEGCVEHVWPVRRRDHNYLLQTLLCMNGVDNYKGLTQVPSTIETHMYAIELCQQLGEDAVAHS